jgi:hypothetical protein
MWFIKNLLRWFAARAGRQILQGRPIDRDRPENGRFLRRDVDAILQQTWRYLDEMLPGAHLEQIPTLGNRQNKLGAVMTTALYRALRDAEVEKEYAIELMSDAGWKVYEKFATLPRFVARLVSRDPQQQMNLILRAMMRYPFSRPGRPGYECRAWAGPDRFYTYWTFCPAYDYVRQYVQEHGDRGEIEAFQRSWCSYDPAFAGVMVEGGTYERPHALSFGDEVCDMVWYARRGKERARNRSKAKMSVEAMIGQTVTVTATVGDREGQVHYHNELWGAVSDRRLPVGDQARIVALRGMRLVVQSASDDV